MRNFFIYSFRTKKSRPMSFIVNWLGLTLGFSAVIVIFLYIMAQVRHDQCYSESMENVYRLNDIEDQMVTYIPLPLGKHLVDLPGVEAVSNICNWNMTIGTTTLATNKKINDKVLLADSSFFNICPFKLVGGTLNDALSDVGKVVITHSTALKLFGTTDVIGLPLLADNKFPLTITAVIEDADNNSTIQPTVICNFKLMALLQGFEVDKYFESWSRWMSQLLVKVNPNTDIASFESTISDTVSKCINQYWGEYQDKPNLMPFNDIYFSSHPIDNGADVENLWILGFIAILVLVIAIINYVNIYTARATEVIKSMGLRSIMGARRGSLIGFIIGDSVLVAFLSVVSAFLIAGTLKPLYPTIIGETISFSLSWDIGLIMFIVLPLGCGFLCGLFPAFALTRLKPLDAIANRNSGGIFMSAVRNILIVFQFAISVGLISTTLLINKQMRYMNSIDLGYNRENIVRIAGGTFMPEKFELFRQSLMSNPDIIETSIMSESPINIDNLQTFTFQNEPWIGQTVNNMYADSHMLNLMGIELLQGDSLTLDSPYDRWLVTESFVKMAKEMCPTIEIPNQQYVGIIKDFQHQKLTSEMSPLAIGNIHKIRTPPGDGYVKISGNGLDKTIEFIESKFSEFYPNEIFEISFLDEVFNSMYKREQAFKSRLIIFSVLAIFICCLGLFALIGYTVQRRRKEIALRKVYGSNIKQVLRLFSFSFIKWLVIGSVIAIPIVIYAMQIWISQFAYKTEVSWWIFGIAILATGFVALATVLSQTYHAATQNPVKSLKSE